MWFKKLTIITGLALATSNVWAEKMNIFAAASMTNVLQQIGNEYKKQFPDADITYSFAGSSTLAKQIEQDAPADLFISADQKWLEYLLEKIPNKIHNPVQLVQNELVLIAPQGSTLTVNQIEQFNWTQAIGESYLAVGDDNVPVGRYAKKALEYLGVWADVEPRLSKAKDVRAVLTYIERGELPLGIVYATDAKISDKVKIVATFPEGSYGKVIYPAATIGKNVEAERFLTFLSSDKAKELFRNAGFKPLN